jgi:hypothetical protein
VTFLPAVSAEDNTTTTISIDFEPGQSGTNSTIVNLADSSTLRYEKDRVLGALPNIEGKYYGPYIESSLFQFSHEGGYVFFHTNFTIGPEYIMNGLSSFWVRVPVIPSQYAVWHVFCSWGYYNGLEGIVNPDRSFGLLLPWVDNDLWYAWNHNTSSGNVWSTQVGDTYQIRNRESGLYIRYDGIFHPNEPFVMAFWGILKTGQKPQVFLSQERQNLTQTQTFRFYEPYQIRNSAGTLLEYGFTYDSNVSIAADPAWAFLFINGLGKDGLTSYKLSFRNNTTDYLQWGQLWFLGTTWPYPVPGYVNESYFSFYMPFNAVCTAEEAGATVITNTIDWKVELTLETTGISWLPYAEFNRSAYGLCNSRSLTLYVNDTSNYLIFSTPYRISVNWTWTSIITPVNVSIFVKLTPMQQCDITLLAADLNDDDSFWGIHDVGHPLVPPWAKVGEFCQYWHENERASWDSSLSVNAHWLPLYNSMQWTYGQWAKVNETKLYWIYNFGWGVAYSFPGKAQLYMFLDNGGQYFYNGSYQGFVKNLEDQNQSWWEQILQGLVDFVGTIAGWIWDGLSWIWDQLVSLGTWIYNTISSIIQWIISVAKDIGGKVSNIVSGMLYGFPILVVLFVVNYAGNYLYTGRIPKFTKERRLLRKMRPRAILKQRAKYQKKLRKLKYPIVKVQQVRQGYQKYAKYGRERRSQRYESAIQRSTGRRLKYQEQTASSYRRIGKHD